MEKILSILSGERTGKTSIQANRENYHAQHTIYVPWFAQNAEASKARDAILLGNTFVVSWANMSAPGLLTQEWTNLRSYIQIIP